jgi:hypothetical protein
MIACREPKTPSPRKTSLCFGTDNTTQNNFVDHALAANLDDTAEFLDLSK